MVNPTHSFRKFRNLKVVDGCQSNLYAMLKQLLFFINFKNMAEYI